MILDTCFFIDLQRKPASVLPISERLAAGWICTTSISCGELAVGLAEPSAESISAITLGVPVLAIDEAISVRYGVIKRHLRSKGIVIGENDTWIAAAALAYGLPIVTRNVEEFSRVPGLALVTYEIQ